MVVNEDNVDEVDMVLKKVAETMGGLEEVEIDFESD